MVAGLRSDMSYDIRLQMEGKFELILATVTTLLAYSAALMGRTVATHSYCSVNLTSEYTHASNVRAVCKRKDFYIRRPRRIMRFLIRSGLASGTEMSKRHHP
jgi:hypothetical protein